VSKTFIDVLVEKNEKQVLTLEDLLLVQVEVEAYYRFLKCEIENEKDRRFNPLVNAR
jgi:hypothetical protein